jgi:DNA-binding beta-propeller fold protein YncE
VGTEPVALAFDPAADELFVANLGSNNITVLNSTLLSEVGNVAIGGPVDGVIFDPGSGLIYALSQGGSTPPCRVGGPSLCLTAVNPSNLSPVSAIAPETTGPEGGLAIDPGAALLFFAGRSNTTVLDTSNFSYVTKVHGWGPTQMAFSPLTGDVYGPSCRIGFTCSENLSVINGTNISAGVTPYMGTLEVGVPILSLGIDPNTGYLILGALEGSGRSGETIAVDPVSQGVVWMAATGTRPLAIATDTTSGIVCIVDNGTDQVTLLNGSTGSFLGGVATGADPSAAVFDSHDELLFVANFGSNSVSYFNPANAIGPPTQRPGPVPLSPTEVVLLGAGAGALVSLVATHGRRPAPWGRVT